MEKLGITWSSLAGKALLAIFGVLVFRTVNVGLNIFDLAPEEWLLGLFSNTPSEALLEFGRWTLAVLIVGFLWLFFTGWQRLKRRRSSIPIAFNLAGADGPPRFSNKHPWIEIEGNGEPRIGTVQIFGFGDVLFTNISPTRTVTLDITLHIRGKNDKSNIRIPAKTTGPFGRVYRKNDIGSLQVIKHSVDLTPPFDGPITLNPNQSITRDLAFICDVGFDDAKISGEIAHHVVHHAYNYAVEITDHISGTMISVPVPVEYRGS